MPSSSLVRSKVISSSEVSLPAANDTDDGMVNRPDSSLARTATVSASSLAMRFTGRDGDGGDVVADAMLGGHILGEVDLCAVDLGTCFEVIVAAGREQPRDDGDSRQKEYFYTFHK